METNSEERRNHLRIPVNLTCVLNFSGHHFMGTSGNISLGGIYIENTEPELPASFIGKKGEVTIQAKDHHITIDCQIRHLSSGAGLLFRHLDRNNNHELRAIIEQYT